MADTNRNGHFGDFGEFRAKAVPMDEVLAALFKSKAVGTSAGDIPKERIIARPGGYELVRHNLSWSVLGPVFGQVGSQFTPIEMDLQDRAAVFSLRQPGGAAEAVITVMAGRKGPEIIEMSLPIEAKVPTDVMHSALVELDVPPSRSRGQDSYIAVKLDCWYEEGAWVVKEPIHVVAVTLERVCFATTPSMQEIIDVMVPFDPDHPLEGDQDERWESESCYIGAAMERITARTQVRPGFSSWLSRSVGLVKVGNPSIAEELKEIGVSLDGDARRVPSP